MVKQGGFCLGAAFLFLTGWCTAQDKPAKSPLPAQKTTSDLPRVIRASVPFYPEIARQTRIQGTVTLRVSTDGKLVSDIGAGSGHPILVEAATENVKTWEFNRMPRQVSRSHFATDFSSQSVIPSATAVEGKGAKRSRSSSICRLTRTLVRRHCLLVIPSSR